MKQEVKAIEPNEKKLFEWDPEQKILSIKLKGWNHNLHLGKDELFKCVSSKRSQNN